MDFSFIIPKNTEPYPFNEDQEAWLKELETTERKKGYGYLEARDNTFCCLGIACHLFGAIREEGAGIARLFKMTEDGPTCAMYLPVPLAYRLRLRDASGLLANPVRISGAECNSLAGMNDATDYSLQPLLTFKDIAAYIRHDPWNVFISEEEAKKRYDCLPLP